MKTLIQLVVGLALISLLTAGCGGGKGEAGSGQGQPESLFSCSYKISPGNFVRNLKALTAPAAGESNQQLLLRFFKENNVAIEPPAAVLLDEMGNRLLVRVPETEKEKVEALVGKIQKLQ